MFDIHKTLTLVKGGFFEPREAWQRYLEEKRDWKETAVLITIPLIATTVILTSILAWVFSSYMQKGMAATLLQLIVSFIGVGIASFIFSYLAGIFGGKHDFDKGLAALSLAAIPAMIGSVLGTMPFIGMVLSLVLGILGLVYLYKIIPSYLDVPQGKIVLHFILSLLATIAIMGGLGILFGLNGSSQNDFVSRAESNVHSGMFGELGRQAELMERAEQDTFVPSKDAEITETQMMALLTTLKKTAAYKKTKEDAIKSLDKQAQNKDASFSDLMKMASGLGSVVGAANAEMDIVKSAGGNWAEHTWVKEQLRIAVMQKDITDAVKHNYSLYKKHADELSRYGYTP